VLDRAAFGALGLGGAGLGNLFTAITDTEATDAIEAAWQGGVRYFDTAPHYGLGLSERRLGRVLAGKPRSEFVVSTKVGRVLVPDVNPRQFKDDDGFDVPADYRRVWDPSPKGVRRSLEDSLTRLGLDSVDVLYLHDPDVYDLESGIQQALPELEKIRAEGLVGSIGVGSNSAEALLACVQRADLDLIMLAGRFTLLEQPALAELLPTCVQRRVGVVNASVFNSGLMARPTVPDEVPYNYAQAPANVIDRARRLAAACTELGVELPTAALQFGLLHPAVVGVVAGAASAEQVRENLGRMQTPLPDGFWNGLSDRGLIPDPASWIS
jgi:D-threo-aldose 1-dehydrogenase